MSYKVKLLSSVERKIKSEKTIPEPERGNPEPIKIDPGRVPIKIKPDQDADKTKPDQDADITVPHPTISPQKEVEIENIFSFLLY